MQVVPEKTALIAMHVQRETIGSDRFDDEVASSNLVENLAPVLVAARDAGVTIIYPKVAFAPGYPGLDLEIPLYAKVKESGVYISGTPGVEIVPELAPQHGDVEFEHVGTSAFVGGRLEDELGQRRINTVVIAGLATNNAVEGTARDASNRGLRTYLIEDCCAGTDPRAHEASLDWLRWITHGVVESSTFLSALEAPGGDPGPAGAAAA